MIQILKLLSRVVSAVIGLGATAYLFALFTPDCIYHATGCGSVLIHPILTLIEVGAAIATIYLVMIYLEGRFEGDASGE